MKLHKNLSHKICPVCSKIFYRLYHKSKKQWDEQNFCSKSCGKLKLSIEEYKKEKLQYILSRTKQTEKGCLEWNSILKGRRYPIIHFLDKQEAVHRVVWKICKGDISKNMCICHTCDNPKCVNILHLFKGTHKDNMKDKVNKGRQAKGNKICQPMFTQSDIQQIFQLRQKGLSMKEISEKFNTTKQTIWRYLHKSIPIE